MKQRLTVGGTPAFLWPAPPVPRRDREQVDPKLAAAFRGLIRGELDWPLFIQGGTGTGKTCGALCMIDYYGGAFVEVRELRRQAWESERGTLEGSDGYIIRPSYFWHLWSVQPLTVLDEMGTRAESAFGYEVVLDSAKQRQDKPAIYISNLTGNELGELYDDRVMSRIGCGTVVTLKGDDRRMKNGTRAKVSKVG